ncbi:MAG TPA: polysaccharide deacetylase family protein [Hanamia sp.]|nr:polysaccharide deacetylase family protein [Hanamia sp.]
MVKNLFFVTFFLSVILLGINNESFGQTEICKWQFGKSGAVSITYDDGYITQFKEAMPVMNKLNFPGTFFIVTGKLAGSRYTANFVGRPVKDIINETKSEITNKKNFFERASAVRFLGYKGTLDYFFKAGQLYEGGKLSEAYRLMDSAYAKVRSGVLSPGVDVSDEAAATAQNSWAAFKEYASHGHELACHSISHPFFAILDEANMQYELEKSKEDILNHLGIEHAFSAEIPFGTEDSRAMKYALQTNLFEALRNIMPDNFLHEINRGYKEAPGISKKEYVQWQRGPLSKTPMSLMKSWVDTLLEHDNIWLVLVFHGVDNVGWEPLKHEDLATYFQYIKDKEDKLWVATFKDVTKYMRERMHVKVNSVKGDNKITVSLNHSLDQAVYNLPLTLKTYVLPGWNNEVTIKQGDQTKQVQILKDNKGSYVLFQAIPNTSAVELSGN